MGPGHTPCSLSSCRDLIPAVPLLGMPCPCYWNGQSLIFQVSITSFFFTALMIWNYQVHLLMDFLPFASQCTIYIVDDWMNLEQIPRPLVRIDKALESQVTWTAGTDRKRSAASTTSVLAAHCVGKSSRSTFRPLGRGSVIDLWGLPWVWQHICAGLTHPLLILHDLGRFPCFHSIRATRLSLLLKARQVPSLHFSKPYNDTPSHLE